jgi:hypothetical protein
MSEVEFLVKLRDAACMIKDACETKLETLAPVGVKQASVLEETFTCLSFEAQRGEKLGEFETANKENNDGDKFQQAWNILTKSNAAIDHRYHGTNYAFAYWTYADRIFRQKLKK